MVLRSCKHKDFFWPPEPDNVEVSPEWQFQKPGLQECISCFLEDTVEEGKAQRAPSWSPQPVFLESSSMCLCMCAKSEAFLSVGSSRTSKVHQMTKGQRSASVQSVLCPEEVASQDHPSSGHSPGRPRNTSPSPHQNQVIKGHPPGTAANTCKGDTGTLEHG